MRFEAEKNWRRANGKKKKGTRCMVQGTRGERDCFIGWIGLIGSIGFKLTADLRRWTQMGKAGARCAEKKKGAPVKFAALIYRYLTPVPSAGATPEE